MLLFEVCLLQTDGQSGNSKPVCDLFTCVQRVSRLINGRRSQWNAVLGSFSPFNYCVH